MTQPAARLPFQLGHSTLGGQNPATLVGPRRLQLTARPNRSSTNRLSTGQTFIAAPPPVAQLPFRLGSARLSAQPQISVEEPTREIAPRPETNSPTVMVASEPIPEITDGIEEVVNEPLAPTPQTYLPQTHISTQGYHPYVPITRQSGAGRGTETIRSLMQNPPKTFGAKIGRLFGATDSDLTAAVQNISEADLPKVMSQLSGNERLALFTMLPMELVNRCVRSCQAG